MTTKPKRRSTTPKDQKQYSLDEKRKLRKACRSASDRLYEDLLKVLPKKHHDKLWNLAWLNVAGSVAIYSGGNDFIEITKGVLRDLKK